MFNYNCNTTTTRFEDLPDLLTRQELAAFLRVSVPTLARWAMNGEGPKMTKIGHAARYKKADVGEYLHGAVDE